MERSRLEKIYNAMKLIDLKKHLRNRGVSVNSHLKPGLVAIACAVEEMKLPLIHRINEEEQLNVNRHLFIHGIQLTDPFKANAVNDFKNSPPFGLFDIFNHLIYHSCEYDKQGLAAYKSYEDYRLFRDGYVESLLTYYSKDAGVHVYVGKVKPAMKAKTKEGKEFYDSCLKGEVPIEEASLMLIVCVWEGEMVVANILHPLYTLLKIYWIVVEKTVSQVGPVNGLENPSQIQQHAS